jgi:hypothetical protein
VGYQVDERESEEEGEEAEEVGGAGRDVLV